MIRQIGLADSGLSHVSRAISWIRDNYAEPMRIEDLARLAGMSPSAFHRHFRAVTAMSPLQFQKRIRLQEARSLLLARPGDVAARRASRRLRQPVPVQPRVPAAVRRPAGPGRRAAPRDDGAGHRRTAAVTTATRRPPAR